MWTIFYFRIYVITAYFIILGCLGLAQSLAQSRPDRLGQVSSTTIPDSESVWNIELNAPVVQ